LTRKEEINKFVAYINNEGKDPWQDHYTQETNLSKISTISLLGEYCMHTTSI
jgi:hypothetical protein